MGNSSRIINGRFQKENKKGQGKIKKKLEWKWKVLKEYSFKK